MTTRVLWMPPLKLVHAHPLLSTSGPTSPAFGQIHPLHTGLLPLPCCSYLQFTPGDACLRSLLSLPHTLTLPRPWQTGSFPAMGPPRGRQEDCSKLIRAHLAPCSLHQPPTIQVRWVLMPPCLAPPHTCQVLGARDHGHQCQEDWPLAACGAPALSPETHKEGWRTLSAPQPAGPCHYL